MLLALLHLFHPSEQNYHHYIKSIYTTDTAFIIRKSNLASGIIVFYILPLYHASFGSRGPLKKNRQIWAKCIC